MHDEANWGATIVDVETDEGLLIKNNVIVRCRTWATSVAIPEGITEIKQESFENCTKLTSVVIPSSVLIIGSKAFANCQIKKILNYATTPQDCEYEALAVEDKSACELYVPAGSVEQYKAHYDWGQFNVKAMDDVMVGIEGLSPTRPQGACSSGIYDLSGRRMSTSLKANGQFTKLPKNIYIMNGRNVLVK